MSGKPSGKSAVARALSDQIEPFDRDDFVPWPGALRMAMRCHRQRSATPPRRKDTRPSVGRIGPPGSLRRSPDAQASRFAPRLPGKPIRSHQIESIWSESALGGGAPISKKPVLQDARNAWLPVQPALPVIGTAIGSAPAPSAQNRSKRSTSFQVTNTMRHNTRASPILYATFCAISPTGRRRTASIA